jgi:prohibitin 2
MGYFSVSNWTTEKETRYGGKEIYPRVGKLAIHGLFWIVLLVTLLTQFPLGTVGAGERGIRTRFGAVTGDVLGEGLYFRMPFVEKVVKVTVRVQKEQTKADAASKDLQTVTSDVALNFRLEPNKVDDIYKELGVEYKENVIAPALQEVVKATTAKFTAEELVAKREQVAQDITVGLRDRLQKRGIVVEQFSVVNFDFSKSFNEAIENKVSAEQNAQASRNKLEQVKYEAQAEIEKAKGKAEAIRVEAQALKDNPEVSQLRAIEKWDGKLPTYTGGATPLINIK